MRVALERDGVIFNIIEAESVEVADELFPDDLAFEATSEGIGWVRQPDDSHLPPTPATPNYRPIDKVEAMGLIRAVTGMTPVEELAFRDDPNLALFWRIWREDVGSVIHHDNPLTATILDALQATGYLSAPQRQAVLDNWPTA